MLLTQALYERRRYCALERERSAAAHSRERKTSSEDGKVARIVDELEGVEAKGSNAKRTN